MARMHNRASGLPPGGWPSDPNFILVLEDDAATAQLLKTVIEYELAIRVQVAKDGQSALDTVAYAPPLAIIIDPRVSASTLRRS